MRRWLMVMALLAMTACSNPAPELGAASPKAAVRGYLEQSDYISPAHQARLCRQFRELSPAELQNHPLSPKEQQLSDAQLIQRLLQTREPVHNYRIVGTTRPHKNLSLVLVEIGQERISYPVIRENDAWFVDGN